MTINDTTLNTMLEQWAAEIVAEHDFDEEACQNAVHEYADGSEYAIYYGKGHELCQNCNVAYGEEFVEEMGGFQPGDTYDSMACKIAYGEIYTRLNLSVYGLLEEHNAA